MRQDAKVIEVLVHYQYYARAKEANTYQDYESRDGQRAWRDMVWFEGVLVSRLLRVGNGRNCNGETSV